MLDFCGQHNLTADVEIIPIQKINEAYERMVKSDVKYRIRRSSGPSLHRCCRTEGFMGRLEALAYFLLHAPLRF